MEDLEVIVTSWSSRKSAGNTGSKANRGNTHMGSERSLHMEPSPLPVLRDSSSEGPWRRTLRHVQLPRGWRSSTGSTVGLSGAVFSKPTRNRGPSSASTRLRWETQEGNRFHTKAIESSECVRGRPARSSTNICQWGATSQRPGGRYTSRRVSSQPERARHTLCLISQVMASTIQWAILCLEMALPFLPASVTEQELVWGPEALRPVNVVSQCSDGTSKARAGLPPPGGSACRLTTGLVVGTLGT